MSSDERFQEALEWVGRSLESDRVAHGYVVVGAPQTEGRRFAMEILDLLHGGNPAGPEGNRLHPDVLWLEPEKKSRIIAIDPIREACIWMSRTAFAGGWKACILVGADRLGPAAANAFLKTLEEPLGKSVFLLLTDQPAALLPTIVSRCQRITLSGESDPVSDELRREMLEILRRDAGDSFVAGREKALQVVTFLEGIKQGIDADVKAEIKAREEETGEEVNKDRRDARIESRYRAIRSGLLRLLMLWHRDILMAVSVGEGAHLHFDIYAADLWQQASHTTHEQALRNIGVVQSIDAQLGRSMGERTVMTLAMSRLSQSSF